MSVKEHLINKIILNNLAISNWVAAQSGRDIKDLPALKELVKEGRTAADALAAIEEV